MPPFVVYRTSRIDDAKYGDVRDALGQSLDDLWTTAPIAVRPQNGGAYAIPAHALRDDLAPGRPGFAAHIEEADEAKAAETVLTSDA